FSLAHFDKRFVACAGSLNALLAQEQLSARVRAHRIPSIVGIFRRCLFVTSDSDVAARETEFAQFVLERLPVHAEDGGGARGVAARLFEAARDVAPLKFAPVLAK